jgi:hypothetical protein
MPFWIAGSTTCRFCGKILLREDEVFTLPPAWLPRWEPMVSFVGEVGHQSCWLDWSLRERFIDRVNQPGSGYRFRADGLWEFVGEERGK